MSAVCSVCGGELLVWYECDEVDGSKWTYSVCLRCEVDEK